MIEPASPPPSAPPTPRLSAGPRGNGRAPAIAAVPAGRGVEWWLAGGRLFAIVGEAPAMSAQLVTCTAEGACQSVVLFETNVAPLTNAPRKDKFSF